MLTVDQIIEGNIETLAFGGEGILRFRGFVVFVPFTAVGDFISCRITEVKRSFAKGELVSLNRASSQRTPALCPYFGQCGGCQLQHLQQEAQLSYKHHAVEDALKRIGHLSPPPFTMIPAKQNWSYRRHISLHLKPYQEAFQAGYVSVDNHSLVQVNSCPIFTELSNPILEELQSLVKRIPNPLQHEGRVTLLKNSHDQFLLSFQFDHTFTIPLKLFQTTLQESPHFSGILVLRQDSTPEEWIALGETYCEEIIEDLTFRFSPRTFIQNHPEQSLNIAKKICGLVGDSHQTILDLYCGFGLSSLLLAKRGHPVTGIELNDEAIRFAKENRDLNRMKNAHFLRGDVEKLLPAQLKKEKADTIIVNPPRQGLSKKTVQTLLHSGAETLLYISCMPSTLARDLNLLAEKYEIKDGWIYDMFPQTAHVETLTLLKKTKPKI